MQLNIHNNTIHIHGELPAEQWPAFVEACNRLIAQRTGGEVPGSDTPDAAPPQPAAPLGPGDHLHAVIRERLNIEPTATCGCEGQIFWMNQIGVEACIRARESIIDNMVEQGRKQLTGWRHAVAFTLPGGVILARHEAASMFDEAMERAGQG